MTDLAKIIIARSVWTLVTLFAYLPGVFAGPSPNAGSPLTSYTVDSAQHVIFIDTNNHVHEFFNGGSGVNWGEHDLTASAAALNPNSGSPLTSYAVGVAQHVIFIDTNNHVHELYNAGSEPNWHEHDLTASASAPNSNAGSPLTSYAVGTAQHVVFIDFNNHVHELWNAGSETNWHEHDLTASAAAPNPSTGSPLTSYAVGTAQHVVFIDTNNHVHELWNAGFETNWHEHDLTASAAAPNPNAGTPLTSYAADSAQHVVFIDTNNHVHELFNAGTETNWHEHDLTTSASALPPIAGSALTSYTVHGAQRVIFISKGYVDVQELFNAGSEPNWHVCDVTLAAYGLQPLSPATGSPLTSYAVGNSQHVMFIDTNNHLQELFNAGSQPNCDWQGRDLSAPSLAFNPASITLAQGNSQSATVTIPNATTSDTLVNLNPANANVSVSPAMVTIPHGTNASGAFSIQGVRAGSSTVTASAAGFQNGVLNVVISAVPAGTFDLQITPQAQNVSWGQPAIYSVQITGRNNFSGNVSLSATNVPSGAKPVFAPNPVMVTAASATQTSMLTLATTQAATRPGQRTFSVQASAAGVPTQTVNLSIHVLRAATSTNTKVTPNTTGSSSCTRSGAVGPPVVLPATVSAIVGTALNGPGVKFQTASGNSPTYISFAQYAISSTCRVGIVVPPVSPSGQIFLDFYNLDFGPSTGASYPIPSNNGSIPVAFQAIYFSKDDSLVVVIGPGSSQAQIATLWDMVTGTSIGSPQYFTASNLIFTLTVDRATLSGTGPRGQPISFSWTVP
jgi:hypothetical protein